jgi:hypothetical protein
MWENLRVILEARHFSGVSFTVSKKTISLNMKLLEVHKCLVRIWDGREVYFIINPYLMFKGDKINKSIPKMFDLLGYKK